MINIVKKIPSLYMANLSHIILGIVCIILFTALLYTWQTLGNVRHDLTSLQQQLAEASHTNDCTSRDAWRAGSTRVFTMTFQGETRTYRVHLPKAFTRTKRYPILLALAGKGEHAKEFQLSRGLDTLPAITIYPEPTLGIDGITAWQGAPYSSEIDDLAFINNVLDRVEGQLCVQKSRVYAVGWSNGGGLAWLLSCRQPDRIAAFAMIAGAFYYPEHACHAKRPTSVLTIHGDLDSMVPYSGSPTRKLPAIEEWIAARAKNNGCDSSPLITYPDIYTQVNTWQGCDHKTTIQGVRLLGGEHAWPIVLHTTSSPSESTLTTPEALWSFFSQHPMR